MLAKRDQGTSASDPVRFFDGVTDGVDVSVAGRLSSSTAMPPWALERQAGHLGQTDVGTNADDPTTSSPGIARPSARRIPLGGHLGDGHAGLDTHPVRSELGGHQDGQLGVERA